MLDTRPSVQRSATSRPVSRAARRVEHPRVVDVVVDRLYEAGVRHVFGVGGTNIEDLYDALHDHPDMTAVVAKHEFSAAVMADGYARAGGRPHPPEHPLSPGSRTGVVMATSGGGCLNLVAGLGESYASRVPVLAIIGQPPTSMDGFGAVEDGSGRSASLDVAQVFGAVSVFCRRAQNPAHVPQLIVHALEAARRLSGPAVVILPKDVQQAQLDAVDLRVVSQPHQESNLQANGLGLAGFAAELAKAAPNIVILAGDEVGRNEARAELAELARVLGASVAVAPDAKDVMSPADRHLIGVAGSMGHPNVGEALQQASVCLLVGTRVPVHARGGLERALAGLEVLSLGERPPFVDAAHLLTTDLRATLRALAKALRPMSKHCQPPVRPPTALDVPQVDTLAVTFAEAIRALDEAIGPEADIVVDAGNTGAACVHHLPVRENGRFVVALGMGGMGYSFGAGIGCAFARGRRTFVIAGDGAFFMHGMEVHTAVEHDLPVTFVVINNNAHGMCVTREQLFYSGEYSYNRFQRTRIGAGMAAMFPQLPSFTAETADELATAFAQAAAASGPSFVEIVCDSEEIPPFVPFLAEIAKKSGR